MSPRLRELSYWTLLLAPFLGLLGFILAFVVDVPFADDWDLLPDLEKMDAGTLTLGDLYAQHFDHRLLFPKLLLLGLARLSAWHPLLPCLATFVAGIAVFLGVRAGILLASRHLSLEPGRWVFITCAWLICSWHQWRNWLWGWQVQMLFGVAAVLWGLVVLGSPRLTWLRLLAAALLAIAGTFSFASGLLLWPLGWLLLVRRAEPLRGASTGWAVLAVAVMFAYFWDFRFSVMVQGELQVEHTVGLAMFVGSGIVGRGESLGMLADLHRDAMLLRTGQLVGLVGLITFVLLGVWLVVGRGRTRVMSPLYLFGLFGIVNGVALLLGRLRSGGVAAVGARHVTFSVPIWISVIALGYLAARLHARRSGSVGLLRLWGWAIGLLFGLLVPTQLFSWRAAQAFHRSLQQGRRALIEGTRMTDALGFDPYRNHQALGLFRRSILDLRLSVFRDEAIARRARAASGPPVRLRASVEARTLRAEILGARAGCTVLLFARVPPDAPFVLAAGVCNERGSYVVEVPVPSNPAGTVVQMVPGVLNQAGALELGAPVQLQL